jgi:hypothetical protein
VARFDGRAWTAIAPVPGPRNVGRALWADPAGEVLFTTTEHAILRFSGGAWSSMDAPLASRAPYQLVSFGGEHAFTVGPERVIAWDGDAYAAYDAGTWRDLYAIWGQAEDDLWIGGGHGAVVHFDGQRMEPRSIETDGAIVQLWGASQSDLWAVAENPWGVFHWDGRRWRDRTGRLREQRIRSVGGTPDQVYAAGDFGVAHWTGARWQDVLRVEQDYSSVPHFSDVCATRTHILIAEGGVQTWVMPILSESI